MQRVLIIWIWLLLVTVAIIRENEIYTRGKIMLFSLEKAL